jgi:6-phosphogluconate dehydrogenase
LKKTEENGYNKNIMQVALLGLGKMGRLIAEKLMAEGHQVVVWNRTKDVIEQFKLTKAQYIVSQKLVISHTVEELRQTLLNPRVFWSMLPAGEPTETLLDEISGIAESGDIVIDGGNAHFTDTDRRYQEFQKKGVKFIGMGVSGGIHGFENGFCLMAGGNREAYTYITPLLDSLSKPNALHAYFGDGAAGHYVKMVHNAIEYGMMQALGEGFGLLSKSHYKLNLVDVAATWQRGSIVSSFLLQMAYNALLKDPTLAQVEGYIDATGEAKWALDDGKLLHQPVDVIEKSLEFRTRSQYDKLIQSTFAAKLIAALRREFGGHSTKAKG